MSLVRRPQQVRALMDDPAFTQRTLDRVTSVLGISESDGVCVVDVSSAGCILPASLRGTYVVRIGTDESLAAKIVSVASTDGACRFFLGSWCIFIDHDLTRPPLEQGIHLWLGAAWRLVPLARTAS